MYTNLLFVLLQLSLLGSTGEPMSGSKLYVNNAASNELVGFVNVGRSGQFEFSNLDPGNYYLTIEIEDFIVKKVDKKERQKFDSDIEIAYNKDKGAFCWQRADGYMKLDINRQSKIADALIPSFEPEILEKENQKKQGFYDIPQPVEKADFANQTGKIKILQFTVIDEFGMISGDVLSISQKEFHKLVVGNNDISLENSGEVTVLKRLDK